jgi:N-acetylmuramoyl-L-alanine amidase
MQIARATFALFVALALGPASPALAGGPSPLSPTVVIDPGHGGSNIGAPGRGDVAEERITLTVARMLRRRLRLRGMVVVLTRERDVYVTLAERVRRANAAGAKLFLSIHGNSSPTHDQRGFETFVAAREVVDVAADRAAATEHDQVAALRARAQVRLVASESERLARCVQRHLAQVRENDRGVRQAAYDVLDGVRVPAALVEVGFVDHPDEGEELLKAETLRNVADALADGISDFLTTPAPPPQALPTPPPPRLVRHLPSTPSP